MDNKNINSIITKCNKWLKEDLHESIKYEIKDVISKCKNELLRNELINLGYNDINEKSSINASEYYSYISNCYYHKHIIKWGEKCKISWLDYGYNEPIKNNYYVEISFSTGPYYICHTHNDNDYDEAKPFFNKIWNEIVLKNPDSLDTHNRCAFFEIHREDSIKIWNEIDDIIAKYKKEFEDYLNNNKDFKIKKLEEELKRLKNE